MMMTEGGGFAASLKALAASFRPSTSLCWPPSKVLATVETGENERMVELISVEAGTTVEEEGCQEDDEPVEEGEDEAAGVDEDDTGAEKLAKIPDNDEASRL